ncbi:MULTISPECIES: phosphoribosylanthranilate isomerase [Paenibacillus]|uniref:N-(5'-phosphoribosyl)anthranilate isomerase n=1 Tax=Paenibacillus validus TaxID=44253 RepID=A0A7X2ZBG2_9BACL|nr:MULTISPECIES: phosphoribosylanthranilate isomerase [Paenibacillus]MUG71734.1 phosphoribosylanthranilate isomerase [Paenibacillus validus]
MALVKICGLQTPDLAAEVARLPVDYVGFVFARSKRQVSAAQAGAMIAAMREASPERRVKAAGVFVNPALEELDAVLREAPLDVLQLHGQETPDYCRTVKERYPGVEVIKAFSLPHEAAAAGDGPSGAGPDVSAIADRFNPYLGTIDGILLDTLDPLYGGGSGKTFAWHVIPSYLAWSREAGIPLLVAGGLRPDNVGSLLDAYHPDGVDVSSGVETDGAKDLMKIKTFVERVKSIV